MDGTKKIRVTIDQLGRSKVEAFGFSGGACHEATAPIAAVLGGGGNNVITEFKPEYNMIETSNEEANELHN